MIALTSIINVFNSIFDFIKKNPKFFLGVIFALLIVLLFKQCDECSEKTENTCSTACQEMIHLPYETQKELRKGKHASNKIFKKGRSEVLPFKS